MKTASSPTHWIWFGEQFAWRYGGINFPLLQYVGFEIRDFEKILQFMFDILVEIFLQAACEYWKSVVVVAAFLNNHRLITIRVDREEISGEWVRGDCRKSLGGRDLLSSSSTESRGCAAEGGRLLVV